MHAGIKLDGLRLDFLACWCLEAKCRFRLTDSHINSFAHYQCCNSVVWHVKMVSQDNCWHSFWELGNIWV